MQVHLQQCQDAKSSRLVSDRIRYCRSTIAACMHPVPWLGILLGRWPYTGLLTVACMHGTLWLSFLLGQWPYMELSVIHMIRICCQSSCLSCDDLLYILWTIWPFNFVYILNRLWRNLLILTLAITHINIFCSRPTFRSSVFTNSRFLFLTCYCAKYGSMFYVCFSHVFDKSEKKTCF